MIRSRSLAVLAVLALATTLMAPAAFAVQCSCHYCVPGNLLAECTWPGYGNVYCVDYWEFQCAWGPPSAPAADQPFAEPLAWLDTVTVDEVDSTEATVEAGDEAEVELVTD